MVSGAVWLSVVVRPSIRFSLLWPFRRRQPSPSSCKQVGVAERFTTSKRKDIASLSLYLCHWLSSCVKGKSLPQAEVCLARGAARQCPSEEDLAVDGQCPVEWHGTGWIYVVWGRVMMLQQRIKTVSDRGWSPGGNLRSCGETREISVHVCLQCSFWLWNVNDDDG